MSNRSEYKLMVKLIDKLEPEQVTKLLSAFEVNSGILLLNKNHEAMVKNKDGSMTALNRIETVGVRNFTFPEQKPIVVETVVEKVIGVEEDFSNDNTIVLEDDK